jgi:hypothetical protein
MRSLTYLSVATLLLVGGLALSAAVPVADAMSVERAGVSAHITRSAVQFQRSQQLGIRSTAQASGSRLGRIPKCRNKGVRGIRPPLSRHEKKKLNRAFRCLIKQFRRADQVVNAFLEAVVTGDGALACLLLTPTERAELGGSGCAQRMQAAAPGFAGRDPFIESAGASFGGDGRSTQADYIIRFHNPSDAVLLELGVVHNHWRISDTNNFFP